MNLILLLSLALGASEPLAPGDHTRTLQVDGREPAHVPWQEKRPSAREVKLSDEEWVVLAVNPWQTDEARSKVGVRCATHTVKLTMMGRNTGTFVVSGGRGTKK